MHFRRRLIVTCSPSSARDLVKSFIPSCCLQKSALIQQRTSLSKFGGNLEFGGVKKSKSNSLELEFEMRGQATLLLQIDQEVRDAGKLNPGHTGRWFRVMLKLSVISWHEIFFQHHWHSIRWYSIVLFFDNFIGIECLKDRKVGCPCNVQMIEFIGIIPAQENWGGSYAKSTKGPCCPSWLWILQNR